MCQNRINIILWGAKVETQRKQNKNTRNGNLVRIIIISELILDQLIKKWIKQSLGKIKISYLSPKE